MNRMIFTRKIEASLRKTKQIGDTTTNVPIAITNNFFAENFSVIIPKNGEQIRSNMRNNVFHNNIDSTEIEET
ncbi:MAG: hypothetical protein C0412_19825 [Flavobacterium sp.]|nr:hypothetical protein [Flavobacterium sp.]